MSHPSVSVIIPVYNVASCLPACLESLSAQTFSDWEGLLVDDGSTDACPALCREWTARDPRFSYIRQENAGLSAARNTGIDRAAGDFFFFLDSDDTLPRDVLRYLCQVARDTGADAVCGQDVQYIVQPPQPAYPAGEPLVLDGDAVKRGLFHPLMTYSVCGKLWRRAVFSAARFPVGKRYEDAFLTPKLVFSLRRMALLPDATYFYRMRPGSISHTPSAAYFRDLLDAAAACEDMVRREFPEIAGQAHSRRLRAYFLTVDAVASYPGFRRHELWPVCRSFLRTHLPEILRDPYLRAARKLYALGVRFAPDAVALALRVRRAKRERAYRKGRQNEVIA